MAALLKRFKGKIRQMMYFVVFLKLAHFLQIALPGIVNLPWLVVSSTKQSIHLVCSIRYLYGILNHHASAHDRTH